MLILNAFLASEHTWKHCLDYHSVFEMTALLHNYCLPTNKLVFVVSLFCHVWFKCILYYMERAQQMTVLTIDLQTVTVGNVKRCKNVFSSNICHKLKHFNITFVIYVHATLTPDHM